jgi:hypothetical protein
VMSPFLAGEADALLPAAVLESVFFSVPHAAVKSDIETAAAKDT